MTTDRPIVFMNLVDAWRHDRLDEATTPYLWSLARTGRWGTLEEPFGFNTAPAMFAGLHPAQSNQVHKFWFDPDQSPYGFTRWIPEWLMHLPRGSGRISSWIHAHARRNLHRRGSTVEAHLVDFHGVPHQLRRFFDLAETRRHTEPGFVTCDTIFDVMRRHGRTWTYVGVPDHELRVNSNIVDAQAAFTGSEDLVFVHWSESDWIGHAHGPDSAEYAAILGRIDDGVGKIAGKLAATGRPVRVLAMGDHGMVTITNRIDVAGALTGIQARVGVDYVYFLDSTAARFWFLTERGRSEVSALLARLPGGRPLTDTDLERYHLPRADRRHWDLCWMLDEGWVVSPDFFHTDAAHPVLGMHGYRPEVPHNRAAWMCSGSGVTASGRREQVADTVDVASTLLDLLELATPASFQGVSLTGECGPRGQATCVT